MLLMTGRLRHGTLVKWLGRRTYHLHLVPVRVVDVKGSDAFQHRMYAMPHLDAGFDESLLQLVVRASVDSEGKVMQDPLFLVSREIVGWMRMRDQDDHLWDTAWLCDHPELVGRRARRHDLQP